MSYKVVIEDNAPPQALVVDSGGKLLLTPAATQERLASWIVQHQKTEHPEASTLVTVGVFAVVALCIIVTIISLRYYR